MHRLSLYTSHSCGKREMELELWELETIDMELWEYDYFILTFILESIPAESKR